MAKKRTGLQSEISSIFSGVPVPKKDRSQSQPRSTTPKPDVSRPPRPAAPPARTPPAPTPRRPVKPLEETLPAKVPETKAPEQKIRKTPGKVSRRRKEKLFAPKTRVSSGRQKTSIVLFIIFSIVLVVVLVRPFGTSRRNPTTSGPAGQGEIAVSPKANIKIDWPTPTVYSAELRDPMELGAQQLPEPETLDGLVVGGISYSEDRRFAIIGIQTLQEGDTILGAIIIRINPNSVEFEKDGERFTREVQSSEDK